MSSGSKFEILRLLESKSYYHLNKNEIREVEKTLGKIDSWSFVAHPLVIDLWQKDKHLDRYIIIIETIQASIFYTIKNFLSEHTVNVNSYYTGGTADFICDAYFTKEAYDDFFNSLIFKLKESGEKVIDGNADELVTVFKVDRTLIKGRKITTASAEEKYTWKHIDPIIESRELFELALRNYKSEDFLKKIGGEALAKKYLDKLYGNEIILSYKINYDYCSSIDRQYVPLGQAARLVNNLLTSKYKNLKDQFLSPIYELMTVTIQHYTDLADQVVSHIAINDYKNPIDRHAWKSLIYNHNSYSSINVFSYPLEETLNVSPVILSDLPEVILRGQPYLVDNVHLGRLSHPGLNDNGPKVGLRDDSLLYQGVTFGGPGTGKTTTDITLLLGVIDKVKNAVIIDDSGTIRAKEGLIPKQYFKKDTYVKIDVGISSERAVNVTKEILEREGLIIIECDKTDYPKVLMAVMLNIQRNDDETLEGAPRRISHFLLLEEGHDGFGNDSDKNKMIDEFSDCITKASRKGWCIWMSTQEPSKLGYDKQSRNRILTALHNKIIHHISDQTEQELLVESESYLGKHDKDYLRSTLLSIPPFNALVIGTYNEGNMARKLNPILVKIDPPSKK